MKAWRCANCHTTHYTHVHYCEDCGSALLEKIDVLRTQAVPDHCGDNNVESLIAAFRKRVEHGKAKYGTTTDREDLVLRDWLQHALEETMDQAVYLNRAIKMIDEGKLLRIR